MRQAICKLILRISGWKFEKQFPENVEKFVLIQAPHTSNWDFFWGRVAFTAINPKVPLKLLIKSSLFFFPLGMILRGLGGIPVERGKNNRLTDYCAKLFEENDRYAIAFTPEGTRSYSPKWKKGFYYVAQSTGLPIVVGYLDYKKKKVGFFDNFYVTGNVEEDMKYLRSLYFGINAKNPEDGVYDK